MLFWKIGTPRPPVAAFDEGNPPNSRNKINAADVVRGWMEGSDDDDDDEMSAMLKCGNNVMLER